MANPNDRPDDELAYEAGQRAARRGLPSTICPFGILNLRLRCWWLAGYNDTGLVPIPFHNPR